MAENKLKAFIKEKAIVMERQSRIPRLWSNRQLAAIGHHFSGEVCNVSAWKDEDKEGGYYCDYFPNADSYVITNFRSERGLQDNELELDLEVPLEEALYGRFSTVFNHTTLEHIYDVHRALKNLCLLTNDIVIVVVPFLQLVHYAEGFGDYWRFTPMSLRRMFAENGLEVVYEAYNDHYDASVYLFFVASKHPELWQKTFDYSPIEDNMIVGAKAVGYLQSRIYRLAKRICKLR